MELSYGVVIQIATTIGTFIAIYEAAVIREWKNRNRESQFLLAGIHSVANQKKTAWNHLLNLQLKTGGAENKDAVTWIAKATDEFSELTALAQTLEGAIDPDFSAIASMMDNYKTIAEKGIEVDKLSNRYWENKKANQ